MTDSERGYWRDVGNIDSYFQANMDLLKYNPELNLYSNEWPLRTFNYNFPLQNLFGMKTKGLVWLKIRLCQKAV